MSDEPPDVVREEPKRQDRPGDCRDGDAADDRVTDEHVRDLEDGAGCTEIWEHLTEYRDE